MADLVLGTPIVKAGMVTKDYFETFRQNKEERKHLEEILDVSQLHLEGRFTSALAQERLQRSMDRTREIMNKWDERNVLHRFVRGPRMSKELRGAKDDQRLNLQLLNSAKVSEDIKRMELTLEFCRKETISTGLYGGVHPPLTQLQSAEAMEIYSTAGHAGSVEYDDDIITMVTTGPEEAPSAHSSKFSISETVATHHVFEENINGESSYTRVTKQKIVVKVQMSSEKSRSMAMALGARACGVDSIGITGEVKDQLEVVGSHVDTVMLITVLRRKLGHADVVEVAEFRPNDNDMRPRLVNATDEPVTRWPSARSSRGIRAITAKLFRSMWRRSRSSPCQEAAQSSSSPLLLEHPDTPAPATGPRPLLLPGNSAASSSMTLFRSTATPQARFQQCQENAGNSARQASDGDLFERPAGPHQPAAPPGTVLVKRRRLNMSRPEKAEKEPAAGGRAHASEVSALLLPSSPRRRAMVELDTSPAGGTHGPLLLQHQPVAPPSETPPPPVRRTFNLSKLRRRVRVPAVRQLRMKQQWARLDGASRPSSTTRVSPMFASCLTLCALLLLASLWALR